MPAAILLHGHYLGAWAWDRVRVALEGMAWVIRADALQGSESPWTGAGPHPAGEVSLGMQIAQVAAVVRAMPEPAVVVAHSYSGLILQALLGERDSRERIKAAVFLDATVGRPGDSLLTILDRAVPGTATLLRSQRRDGGRWGLVPPPPPEATGSRYPAILSLLESSRTPAPWGTVIEPLPATALDPESRPPLPCRYVRCAEFPLSAPIAAWLVSCPGWEVETWPTGHLPMLTNPERVVQVILAHS
jgi:pimeloyl-ACP methyl ester carboxylesterase